MGLMVARHDMTTTKDCDFQRARVPLPVAQDWTVESCELHSASEGFRFLIDLVGGKSMDFSGCWAVFFFKYVYRLHRMLTWLGSGAFRMCLLPVCGCDWTGTCGDSPVKVGGGGGGGSCVSTSGCGWRWTCGVWLAMESRRGVCVLSTNKQR